MWHIYILLKLISQRMSKFLHLLARQSTKSLLTMLLCVDLGPGPPRGRRGGHWSARHSAGGRCQTKGPRRHTSRHLYTHLLLTRQKAKPKAATTKHCKSFFIRQLGNKKSTQTELIYRHTSRWLAVKSAAGFFYDTQTVNGSGPLTFFLRHHEVDILRLWVTIRKIIV